MEKNIKTTLPKITSKQQQILLYLYQFRFLNRLHIQKLLHKKDKRRINTWLKDLTEKKYLKKVPYADTFEQITKTHNLPGGDKWH